MPSTLVVGATSDLATHYLNEKHDLKDFVLIARDKNKFKLKFSEKKIKDFGIVDLSKIDEVENYFNSFKNNFSKVIFFNGIDIVKPIQYYKINEVFDSFNVNIISIFVIISNLIKNKCLLKDSSVVIVSSIAGNVVGTKGHTLYSTTKSSISGLVKSLAIELSKKRIKVNSVLPGLIKTENLFNKNKKLQKNEEFKLYESTYPLGFGKPEDLINILDFLMSDKNNWISGQNIIIDGGHTIT